VHEIRTATADDTRHELRCKIMNDGRQREETQARRNAAEYILYARSIELW